jgi:hypothetical protein
LASSHARALARKSSSLMAVPLPARQLAGPKN